MVATNISSILRQIQVSELPLASATASFRATISVGSTAPLFSEPPAPWSSMLARPWVGMLTFEADHSTGMIYKSCYWWMRVVRGEGDRGLTPREVNPKDIHQYQGTGGRPIHRHKRWAHPGAIRALSPLAMLLPGHLDGTSSEPRGSKLLRAMFAKDPIAYRARSGGWVG